MHGNGVVGLVVGDALGVLRHDLAHGVGEVVVLEPVRGVGLRKVGKLVGDLAEGPCGRVVDAFDLGVGGLGRVLARGGKLEVERPAAGPRLVAKALLYPELGGALCVVGVGYGERVGTIVLDAGLELLRLLVARDAYDHVMRGGIVAHAVDAAVGLGNGVVVRALGVIDDGAELCLVVLGVFAHGLLERGCGAGLGGHWRTVERRKRKGEALRLAPVRIAGIVLGRHDAGADLLVVGDVALEALVLLDLLQLQGTGGHAAAQALEHGGAQRLRCHGRGLVRVGRVLPTRVVGRPDLEGDGVDALVARGHRGLRKHIEAVIQAAEAKGRAGAGLDVLGHGGKAAVRELLLEPELRAGKGLIGLVDLVDVHLVGKGDRVVPRRRAFVLAGFALGVQGGVAAVGELGSIDIAFVAQFRVLVERGRELDRHLGAVERGVGNRLLRGTRNLASPVEAHGELMRLVIGAGRERVARLELLAADKDLDAALVEREAILHLVREGEVVLLVARHVVGKRRGQAERHRVVDVVVGGVLPAAGLARGVVDVLYLLLEAGHAGLGVGEGRGLDLGALAFRHLDGLGCAAQQHDARGVLVGELGHGVGAGGQPVHRYGVGRAVRNAHGNVLLVVVGSGDLEVVVAVDLRLLLGGRGGGAVDGHVLGDLEAAVLDVGHGAGERGYGIVLRERQRSGGRGCRKVGEDGRSLVTLRSPTAAREVGVLIRIALDVPRAVVACRDRKDDGLDGLVARRRLGLGQAIGAVVQALNREDVLVVTGAVGDLDQVVERLVLALGGTLALNELLQRELGTRKSGLVLVDLVDVHLVGKGDRVVPRRRALLVVVRGVRRVAVAQLGGIDVARLADVGGLVENRVELHHDPCVVVACGARGNGTYACAPAELERESVDLAVLALVVWRQRVVRLVDRGLDVLALAVLGHDLYAGDLVEVERGLHLVGKGQVIVAVGAHVVRERGGELVGHRVADVVVGGVLPAGRLAR